MTKQKLGVLIWEWPIRVWHWLLVLTVTTALVTGLIPELDLMNVHTWAGMTVVALLVFRLLWGFLGGTYTKLRNYVSTPQQFVNHFRGRNTPAAHTSPGIALAVSLLLALTVQSGAGLFTTDDVLTDGPLVQFVDDDTVELASDVHKHGWKFVLALIGIHLSAQLVYAVFLRNPIALSMFTGRKQLDLPATEFVMWKTLLVYAISGFVLWLLLSYSR